MVWGEAISKNEELFDRIENNSSFFVNFFMLKYILWLLPVLCFGQQLVQPDARVVKSRWEARWIAPREGESQFGVHHFRKSFELKSKPQQFVIHLSADNRYRLFVNGTYVTDGPQISDSRHWRFESLDIAALLNAGSNTLAVQVVNYAEQAPVYLMGVRAAMIVQGNDSLSAVVNSNATWKYFTNPAVKALPFGPGNPELYYQYYAAGPMDHVDGNNFPWGWEHPAYNDAAWPSPKATETGAPFSVVGYGDATWELVPRSIPLMERTWQPAGIIRRSTGLPLPVEKFPVTVPANTTVSLLVDQQQLTSAFPELTLSGGKQSTIKLTYAEGVFNDIRNKGHRDSIQGSTLHGVHDIFIADGHEARVFTTLTYRTFRYVQVEITTQSQPLQISKFGSWFTGYPFQRKGNFEAEDQALAKVFDIGWHTARLCAYETYMDCPYWERLQYVGDTRIQALVSYYVSGDDRLARNALEQFYWSLTYDGLTASRYPSALTQFIPNYSLVWVTMVHDFFMYRNDPEFVRSFLPGIERVLQHFEKYLTPDKLMQEQPYWDFLDHTYPTHKIFTESKSKKLTTNSLFYAYTLSLASELFNYYQQPERAQHYALLSQQLKAGVKRQCWDAARGLFADTPDKNYYSMHANILAILCGMIDRPEQADFLKRVTEDKTLIPTTLYFDFYLGRAMNVARAGDQYLGLLRQWKELLNLGLTTFPEGVTRSECHAWSASPNFEMLATFAGIQPQTPGFKKVLIRPLLQSLQSVKGVVPHWAGEIAVEFEKRGVQLKGSVTLPAGISGRLEWNGKVYELKSGFNSVTTL
ncbi:MAG: alpha-L-rhamnosidase [Cytophagales bacterium]|nr:alpha-L-rhamnosidase [Cytophagales bacterium]